MTDPRVTDDTVTMPSAAETVIEHTTVVEEHTTAVVSEHGKRAEASATEVITCPQCGTGATVTLNRRDSRDFCRSCDFPLFWTPSTIIRDPSGDLSAESLRRLPGQAGRATIASVPCPHCAEPNALSATSCIRCLQPMIVMAPPPAPEPVYVPPPPPPLPVVEDEPTGVPWWVWALLAFGVAVTVALIVLAITGVFD